MPEKDPQGVVVRVLREVLEDMGHPETTVSPETLLDDLGFDSLDWAVALAKLEDAFGFDPFLDGTVSVMPKTVRELAQLYMR